ncbi:FixH family protein [Pacificimonas sp. WHA3]|uniref:FixH family protein n=1 Tax=Pacificimonas pallii TaxID=2827236 RepID=A0ABS6SHT0_9SPHN|nr:FixH family protein [Pacificimonas pallii]
MTRKFTGRHMFIILVLFFGTVIVVNLIMARFAIGTFGGTVVDNSYVASQNYNQWLEEGRSAQALGWTLTGERAETGAFVVTLVDGTGPLKDVELSGTAEHPLGQSEDRVLSFTKLSPGIFTAPLPEGRWKVRLRAERPGQEYRAIRTIE